MRCRLSITLHALTYTLRWLELEDFCFLISLSGLTLALGRGGGGRRAKGGGTATVTCIQIKPQTRTVPEFFDMYGTVLLGFIVCHQQKLHLVPRVQLREVTPTSKRVHVEEDTLPSHSRATAVGQSLAIVVRGVKRDEPKLNSVRTSLKCHPYSMPSPGPSHFQ